MRSLSKLALPLAAFALCLAFAGRAHACSCMGERPVCESFGSARAVFVGKVMGGKEQRTDKDLEGRKVTFDVGEVYLQVEEAFLGVAQGARVVIHSGTGGGDCGYWFRRGERYLVYAYGDSLKQLGTSICTRTRLLADADEDVAFLRNMPNKGAGVRIYGRVAAAVKDAASEDWRTAKPLAGITVKISAGKQTYEAVTDGEGKYERAGLPPGAYKVQAVLPENYRGGDYSEGEPRRINDRGCAEENFFAHNDSRISGRVVDPEGRGLPKVRVELIPVGASDNVAWTRLDADYADEEGRYELAEVAPGRYLLAINYGSTPDSEAPYPRTFHPGTPERAQAAVVEVGMGAKLKEIDIELPAKLTAVSVSGVVRWPDGRPAAGASVHLEDVNHPGWCVDGCGTKTDAEGRFTLRGFVGYTYRAHASFLQKVKDKAAYIRAEPPELKLGGDVFHLKLVLTKEDVDEKEEKGKAP